VLAAIEAAAQAEAERQAQFLAQQQVAAPMPPAVSAAQMPPAVPAPPMPSAPMPSAPMPPAPPTVPAPVEAPVGVSGFASSPIPTPAWGAGAGFAPGGLTTTAFTGADTGFGGPAPAPSFGGPAPQTVTPGPGVVLLTSRRSGPRRPRGLVLVVAGLVVALIAAAVAVDLNKKTSHASTTSGVVTPTGATTVDAHGISVRVPTGWRVLPVKASTLTAYATAETKTDPIAGHIYTGLTPLARSGDLRLLAVQLTPAGTQIASVADVVVQHSAVIPSLTVQARVLRQGLRPDGYRDIVVRRVTLPQGKALQLTATVHLPGQPATTRATEYVLDHGKNIVVFSLQSLDGTTALPGFISMVETFRLT
jgi:hypothetical protein